MADAPSAYKLEQAMSALLSVRQRLLQDDPEMASDERLLADMLEGETGDAMDVLHRMARAATEADAMATACAARSADMDIRFQRYRNRSQTYRAGVMAAMEALGLTKLELPDLTASVRNGQPGVVVTDLDALPEAFVRTTRAPDKTTLLKVLKAGEQVPGAELSNGIASLSIRTK